MSIIKLIALNVIVLFLTIQSTESKAQENSEKVSITAGITLRTNADTYFQSVTTRQIFYRPFEYDQNLIGKRLSLGVEYQLSNRIAIEYYANLGYDNVASYPDANSRVFIISPDGDTLGGYNNRIDIREFLIDHNIQLVRRGKINYGVGFSLINAGKGLENEVNGRPVFQNIQFTSYNAFMQIPLWKGLHTELKIQYLTTGLPTPPNDMLIAMRVFYRFTGKSKT